MRSINTLRVITATSSWAHRRRDWQAIDDDTIVQTATPIRRENARDDDVVRLPGSRIRRGNILDRKLDRGHLRPSTNELGDELADHQIEVLTPGPPCRSSREK